MYGDKEIEEKFADLCQKYPAVMALFGTSILTNVPIEIVFKALPPKEQILCAAEAMMGGQEISDFFDSVSKTESTLSDKENQIVDNLLKNLK